MREIKFRAWNKKEKNFITWDLNFAFGGTSEVWGPVQQFTGLKDKNGKEIYEGDIVKFKTLMRYIIEFYFGSFCLSLTDGRIANSIFEIEMNNIKIIGNIYENPELLETT